MPTANTPLFDHAVQTASTWVHDISREFDTDDRHFAYRVLRAWLHALRDRLPVETAAHFAAQLPELLRDVYYEGWNPNAVPEKYDAQEYVSRFAREANISVADVHRAAPAVMTAVLRHLSPGQVDKVLDRLPEDIRALLSPAV